MCPLDKTRLCQLTSSSITVVFRLSFWIDDRTIYFKFMWGKTEPDTHRFYCPFVTDLDKDIVILWNVFAGWATDPVIVLKYGWINDDGWSFSGALSEVSVTLRLVSWGHDWRGSNWINWWNIDYLGRWFREMSSDYSSNSNLGLRIRIVFLKSTKSTSFEKLKNLWEMLFQNVIGPFPWCSDRFKIEWWNPQFIDNFFYELQKYCFSSCYHNICW